jgi:hypothetical protein
MTQRCRQQNETRTNRPARYPSSSLITTERRLLVMSRISQRRRIDFLSEPAVGCPFGAVMLHFVHWEDRNWLSVDVFGLSSRLSCLSHSRRSPLAHICNSTPMVHSTTPVTVLVNTGEQADSTKRTFSFDGAALLDRSLQPVSGTGQAFGPQLC